VEKPCRRSFDFAQDDSSKEKENIWKTTEIESTSHPVIRQDREVKEAGSHKTGNEVKATEVEVSPAVKTAGILHPAMVVIRRAKKGRR
jgi:hypothetical protein